MTFGVRPLSTRSITDRTGGYEPPDGEFDSPRVYMMSWLRRFWKWMWP